MKQTLSLSQAVLASTLFIVPYIGYADTIVNTPNINIPFTTGVPQNDGNIEITNTGTIFVNSAAINNGDGILVNTTQTTITLDPGNAPGNAAIVTQIAGQGHNGVTLTGGDSSTVTVGANRVITAVADGIFADSPLVDVENSGTIVGSTGIEVSPNGSSFLLTNQATGVVTVNAGPNQALNINGANASIDNFGLIAGTGGILVGGQNATIVNEVSAGATTGTISGTTLPAITVNAANLSLTNSGVITGTALGGDGVQLNQNFTTVTNNSGATISSALNDGINITAGVSGDIQNTGTITTAALAAPSGGIFIGSNYAGSITNNAGGVIQSTGGGGLSGAITTQGSFTAINNSGTIQALAGAGNDSAILVLPGSTAGTLNNSGTIQSQNNSAINLGGNLTQINNSGTISVLTAASPSAIAVSANNVTLAGGIVNTGLIQNGAGGAAEEAIDLQNGKTGVNIKLFQNGGTINGSVLLASNGGSVFDMNGGVITGNVLTTAQAKQTTLNLNGGSITGAVNLLGTGGGDTANIAGSTLSVVNTGPGADIFNLTGGTFTTINGGPGDILNVNATYSTAGDILNVPTINVNAGTFTENNKLTGFTNLNVGPNASMVVNSNTVTGAGAGAAVVVNAGSSLAVAGGKQIDTGLAGTTGSITVLNGGALSLANSAAVTGALTNSFVSQAGGVYGVQIQGPGNFGKMQVNAGGANLQANSFVATSLGSGTFIPEGTQFDIITGGPITDNSTLKQPGSLTITFTKSVVAGNILRLTSHRTGFAPFSNTDASQGVAGALDNIALSGTTNPQLLAVLGQLDLNGNQASLVEELESLAPPVNYAIIAATHVSMDQMFRSIRRRIEDMRYLRTLGSESYQIVGPADMEDRGTGRNYGDSVYGVASHGAWVQGYGAILDQRRRHQIDGYLGDAAGVALGMDWGRQGALVGGALNFTQTHMVGKTTEQNVQDLQSVQGSIYSWIDLTNEIYMDTQVGFASHHYKTRRNIGIGTITTAGFADFFGVHYGAQTEIGYAFLYDYLTVAPLVRLRYTHLKMDDYSEQGAGGLNLTVRNPGLNEGIVGIGLRAVGKKEFAQAVYAPEISAMLAYDFYGDEQTTSSRFLGGGPVFPTIGIKPAQTMMLFDAGVNVHTYDSYIFTVKGELELRDHFYGYSGWVELYRSW